MKKIYITVIYVGYLHYTNLSVFDLSGIRHAAKGKVLQLDVIPIAYEIITL